MVSMLSFANAPVLCLFGFRYPFITAMAATWLTLGIHHVASNGSAAQQVRANLERMCNTWSYSGTWRPADSTSW